LKLGERPENALTRRRSFEPQRRQAGDFKCIEECGTRAEKSSLAIPTAATGMKTVAFERRGELCGNKNSDAASTEFRLNVDSRSVLDPKTTKPTKTGWDSGGNTVVQH